MDYFILEQISSINFDAVKITSGADTAIYKTKKAAELSKFDYMLANRRNHLISDRLKQLFEQFLPHNEWQLSVYMDLDKAAKATEDPDSAEIKKIFWETELPEYMPAQETAFKNNGYVQELRLDGEPPVIFKAGSPPGMFPVRVFSLIVHISVAESMLRRKYLGVKLIGVK
jgi:hypothetical protein